MPHPRADSQPMPKPCPRCGLENADADTHCRRCDAPLQRATSISPAFRQFLLGLAGFAVITTIGVGALVYVHSTAVPLGDPVVPPLDTAAQEEAFAREQALDAPSPDSGRAGLPATDMDPTERARIPGPTAGLPDPATGTTIDPSTIPQTEALDPALDGEDITDQMPEIPSGLDWNREILPPTRQPFPSATTPMPPSDGGGWGSAPAFPESNPLSSAPPILEPGGAAAPGQPGTVWPDAPLGIPPDGSPGALPESQQPPLASDGQQASDGQLASDGQQAPAEADSTSPPQDSGRSLAALQEAQCANEGFLTRFVCHERVRLNYCENRWNRHPDCMLESNVTNY